MFNNLGAWPESSPSTLTAPQTWVSIAFSALKNYSMVGYDAILFLIISSQ